MYNVLKIGGLEVDGDDRPLEPPKILIDTKDRNIVTWRTTFKTGSLIHTNAQNDEDVYPIDGWAVDVRVPLGA